MKFIPELNYWIYKRYFEGPINEYPYEFPVELKEKWSESNSIISLLFNDTFKESSYQIMYEEVGFQGLNDFILTNRLVHYRSDLQVYTSVEEGVEPSNQAQNVLEINEEEIQLLNILFDYRTTSSDSTSGLDLIIFDDLDSGLSKLIYIYLQFVLYGDFSLYNNVDTYADSNRLIELIFEKYVIDTYFRSTANNYLILDSTTTFIITELQNNTEIFELSEQEIIDKQVELENIPYELEDIIVIVDGVNQRINFDYDVFTQDGISYITWDGLGLYSSLHQGDHLYISYSYE